MAKGLRRSQGCVGIHTVVGQHPVGVARHVQHPEVRPPLGQQAGKPRAGHPRHDDVGEQQVGSTEVTLPVTFQDVFGGAARHEVAGVREHLDDASAQVHLVLDDEHSLPPT